MATKKVKESYIKKHGKGAYYKKSRLEKRKYAQKTGSGLYEKKPWHQKEDNMVLKHDIPDAKLSKKLERSVTSIQIRRTRLIHGKVDRGRSR